MMARPGVPLHELLIASARRTPRAEAVREPGRGALTYEALDALSDGLRDRLRHLGIGRGDRVGICLEKSAGAVIALYGILKTGAAYVPADTGAPMGRLAYIFNDCSVAAVVVGRGHAQRLGEALSRLGPLPRLLVIDPQAAGERPMKEALAALQAREPAPRAPTAHPEPGDLAYILYTSGSTGRPKGVMISHDNAVSFVDWCSRTFAPRSGDRFSSHAPFHFDLSILDLFVSAKHGASLVLIPDDVGKDPLRLAPLVADEQISIWYSTPSILALLAQFGKMERYDYGALRQVLFAGEVFHIKHLRALTTLLPRPRYFNLYGPTETNVCTFFALPGPPDPGRMRPFPIGRACSHLSGKVVDRHGAEVARGQEGELCIRGPSVMLGYWNRPEQTARAFLDGDPASGWYRTGDMVVEGADGNYIFLGRRDRMIKKRGYRIELDEIEAAFAGHPAVREAAVIAVEGDDFEVRIKACLCCREGKRPSIIALKKFAKETLPPYMIPDLFTFHDQLPKTSTDKIDYQGLKEMA